MCCDELVLGAEEKRQPPRTTFQHPCQRPCQHPCQHTDIAERSFEDRPSGSTNNACPTQPQKYLVFALKKLAAGCQEKTKKLAAPVINTGLRPVYCRASSSFTQHTPTPTTTPSSYTCLSTTILPLLHPHNTLPHSHNKPTTTLQHLPRTYTFALPFVAFLPLLSGKAVLLTY